MKTLWLIVGIALGALILMLIPPRAFAHQDQLGNVFPPHCSPPAIEAARADVSIMRVQPQAMNAHGNFNHTTLALWIPMQGKDLIMVSDRLAGWKALDAESHEICHHLTNKLFPETKGQWHR